MPQKILLKKNATAGLAPTAASLELGEVAVNTTDGVAFMKNGANTVLRARFTSYDGWGIARTITIGGTGKTVNGSANVSWSLAEIGAAPTSRTITAGNGLSGGGDLTANRTITLGTPSTITGSTTNSATATSHTHEINLTSADVGLGNVPNLDWRDYGLGASPAVLSTPDFNDYAVGLALYLSDNSGNTNIPPTFAQTRTQILSVGQNSYAAQIALQNGKLAYRASSSSQVYGNTGDGTWREVWQDNNLPDPVTRSGTQTLTGVKTFSNPVVLSTAGTATNHAVRADRSISTGDGLSGGGNLTANRTLAVDATVVRTSRSINAGDGLFGGGNLSANRTLSVDGSVSRLNPTGSFSSNGTGWRRVAVRSGSNGRGHGEITLYTTGGSWTPRHIRIKVFKDWGAGAFITSVESAGFGANAVRVTDEGADTYVEVNFTQSLEGNIYSTASGYDEFSRLTGTLPAGGGTVREQLAVGSGFNVPNLYARGHLIVTGDSKASGAFYAGTSNPTNTTRLNYDGVLWTQDTAAVSSRRYKNVEHVVTPEQAAENVRKLGEKGVSVGHYKTDKDKTGKRWLIAEDVAEVMKEPVYFDKKGRPDGLSNDQLIPELYAALAHALKRIDELEARLANSG